MPEPAASQLAAPEPARRPSLPARWARAFGAFWWDFLVGDTPELLIGSLLAIGVVALLVKGPDLNAAAVAAFPALVVVMLVGSVLWARRDKKAG